MENLSNSNLSCPYINSESVTEVTVIFVTFQSNSFLAINITGYSLYRITDDLLNDAQAKLLTEPSENRQNWFLESLLSRKDLDHRDVGLIALELFQAGIDAVSPKPKSIFVTSYRCFHSFIICNL